MAQTATRWGHGQTGPERPLQLAPRWRQAAGARRLHSRMPLTPRGQVVDCGPTLVANPGHLALLRQGVEVWNAWRAQEPSVRPDLKEAYLRMANLRTAGQAELDHHGKRTLLAPLGGARKLERVRCSSLVDWPVYPRLRRIMEGSAWARNSDGGHRSRWASAPTTYAPTPVRRSSTPRRAWKTCMRGCRSERRFGP